MPGKEAACKLPPGSPASDIVSIRDPFSAAFCSELCRPSASAPASPVPVMSAHAPSSDASAPSRNDTCRRLAETQGIFPAASSMSGWDPGILELRSRPSTSVGSSRPISAWLRRSGCGRDVQRTGCAVRGATAWEIGRRSIPLCERERGRRTADWVVVARRIYPETSAGACAAKAPGQAARALIDWLVCVQPPRLPRRAAGTVRVPPRGSSPTHCRAGHRMYLYP